MSKGAFEAALDTEGRDATEKGPGVYTWGGLSFMVDLEKTSPLILECSCLEHSTGVCPSVDDLISFTADHEADDAHFTLLVARSSSPFGITSTLVRLLSIMYDDVSQYRCLSYRHRRIDDCLGTLQGHFFTKWNRRRAYGLVWFRK